MKHSDHPGALCKSLSETKTAMIEWLFWISIAAILFAYGGYSLIVFALAAIVRRPIRRRDITPSVTLLITAYNEEKAIARKLEQSLDLDYPRNLLEIIVASDGSTDRTDEIVKEYAQHGVRLVRVEGRQGKTGTQNVAVSMARGEIVVFSDATTTYDREVIRKIVRNYADETVGAVSGRYEYCNPSGAPVGLGTILFWRYENAIKAAQTMIGTITGCCGCIYSVRRSLYIPLPREIISDLCEPLKIIEQGYRVVFEREALAFEETTSTAESEFAMRVRVISRGMHGLLYMRRLLNPLRYPFVAFQLISHKVLRWLVPAFALLALLANVVLAFDGGFYLATLLLQLVFYGAAAGALLLEGRVAYPKVLALPLYFCAVNAASIVAMIRVIRGVRAVTWETARG